MRIFRIHLLDKILRAKNVIANEVIFEHDRGASDTEISQLLGIPENAIKLILKEE